VAVAGADVGRPPGGRVGHVGVAGRPGEGTDRRASGVHSAEVEVDCWRRHNGRDAPLVALRGADLEVRPRGLGPAGPPRLPVQPVTDTATLTRSCSEPIAIIA
jgi:hypothetical protein